MKHLKVVAAAAALVSLSACAAFVVEPVPVAENTTYIAPQASADPAVFGREGAGAPGGSGAGWVRR